MIHPSRDQQECRVVLNVKIEEICSVFLCAVGGRQERSVSRCLFSEPSGMPAGVWARSVSASEIEVNWQALSFTPERVLGYEVHFTLLNGNRNHTQHNSNACHHPCCTLKAITSKLCRRHGNGCFSWATVIAKIIQFFVPTRQKTCQRVFKRTKENCLSTCLFMLLSVIGYHDTELRNSLHCNTVPDLMWE